MFFSAGEGWPLELSAGTWRKSFVCRVSFLTQQRKPADPCMSKRLRCRCSLAQRRQWRAAQTEQNGWLQRSCLSKTELTIENRACAKRFHFWRWFQTPPLCGLARPFVSGTVHNVLYTMSHVAFHPRSPLQMSKQVRPSPLRDALPAAHFQPIDVPQLDTQPRDLGCRRRCYGTLRMCASSS